MLNNIKVARETKGLSQKQVTIEIGVSYPTVSEWESGKKFPSGKRLTKLSEILEVSTDYLLGNEKPTLGKDVELTEFEKKKKKAMDRIASMTNEDEWNEIEPAILKLLK